MSRHDVEKCIRDYIADHDGTAPAGAVTAHALAQGHSKATIHRVADRIVSKSRDGNAFTWSIRSRPPITATTSTTRMTTAVGTITSAMGGRLVSTDTPTMLERGLWTATPVEPAPPRAPGREVPHAESVAVADALPASKYAPMTQGERILTIRARPSLEEHHANDLPELTESEAIALLELDDDGAFTPATEPRPHLPW